MNPKWLDDLNDLLGANAADLKITIGRYEAPDTELGYVVDVLIEREGAFAMPPDCIAEVIGAWSFDDAMTEALEQAYGK